MIGTENTKSPQYKLKLDYPVKPENPRKCLYIGYRHIVILPRSTSETINIYSLEDKFIYLITENSIPESNHNGLMVWFHDAFEMLFDDAIKINTRTKSYQKVLITPIVSRIDVSIMDLNLEQ